MKAPPARLASTALAPVLLCLASCRAFPVGLYVPGSVLDGLASSRYAEELDELALGCELTARAGMRVGPAPDWPARYWRLDSQPVRGALEPEAFEECVSPATDGLAPGDLVLVKNGRAQSLATTLTFAEFTFYDHMGVLVERAGRWLVCDSWPSFHPLGKSADFAARFRGGVRATPLGTFLAHYETLLVVRLSDPTGNARLAAAALASLDEDIEYDPHHDPADPRLSCSEYMQVLFARAGVVGPSAARAVAENEELRGMLAALGFPSTGFVVPDQFLALPGAHAVAWISRHPSRASARALEAAFAVLHARFLAGDRVADFLGIDRLQLLGYRANVAAFLRWAEGWAEARGVQEASKLASEFRALLPLFFRPAGAAEP